MLRLYNPRPRQPLVDWTWTVGILSAHSLAVFTLVWLAMINPKISVWISEGAEAELAMAVSPDVAPETQISEPLAPMRSTQVVERFYK